MTTAPYWHDAASALYVGDARDVLASMPDASADCLVISPPYWGKRDYGVARQYGRESDPEAAGERHSPGGDDHPAPETVLLDALNEADPGGVSVADLEAACGRTRRWVYYRLREHAAAGRAMQVTRGYWRAARPLDGPPDARRPGRRRPTGDGGE